VGKSNLDNSVPDRECAEGTSIKMGKVSKSQNSRRSSARRVWSAGELKEPVRCLCLKEGIMPVLFNLAIGHASVMQDKFNSESQLKAIAGVFYRSTVRSLLSPCGMRTLKPTNNNYTPVCCASTAIRLAVYSFSVDVVLVGLTCLRRIHKVYKPSVPITALWLWLL